MAVHEYSLPFLIETLEYLANHECLRKFRASEILPEKVEVGDTCVIEYLAIVGEANFVIDAVAAKGMFTRLLQIHDASYIHTEAE